MNAYFISGIGVDGRIFRNIKLPEGYNAVYLDWITPAKDESLKSYAHRLAEKFDRQQPFILVGLSFGGMLANEIDRLYGAEKVILISSVPSSKQIPPYYKLAGKLHLHQLVPISLLKSASLLKRLFTAETSEEKQFLRQAIREADPAFIRWSLGAILNWDNEIKPRNYIHIHGARDFLLPIACSGCTHRINKGGHLMVLTHGKEISKIIKDCTDASLTPVNH
jgi:pimeloyl-ACP methyl ester carboxylesterase